MNKWLGCGLLLFLLLCGCAEPPMQIDRYDPVPAAVHERAVEKDGHNYIEYDDGEFAVSAVLAGSQSILVTSLRVENRADRDLLPSEYSVQLTDGRDHKPLKAIDRDVVIEYRHKIAAGQEIKSGNPMLDLGLNELGGMLRSLDRSQAAQFLRSLDWVVANYFAFRPVYAKSVREGTLCYYVDFILEYPLTLRLRLRDKKLDFVFWPRSAP